MIGKIGTGLRVFSRGHAPALAWSAKIPATLSTSGRGSLTKAVPQVVLGISPLIALERMNSACHTVVATYATTSRGISLLVAGQCVFSVSFWRIGPRSRAYARYLFDLIH
jgi:hypothetical protein